MRRTVGLTIAAATLLLTGGVATAAPATIGVPDLVNAVLGGDHPAAPSRAEVNELRSAAAGAPERVGTTDQVTDVVSGAKTYSYPGASYVKVHFGRLALPPGGYATVTDASGGQARRYPAESGGWAMSVQGDTAVVTVHGGVAAVDRVAHGFTEQQQARQEAADRSRRDAAIKAMQAGSRTESVCGTDDSADAVCYKSSNPVAYKASKAVARLLINGDELCSAWRVGPDNRMFTNHHCFTSTADARDTEVWFNYECEVCGGYATLKPVKVWADQVLATDANLDYTLFTVQDFASIQQFGYLSLDVRDPAAGEQLYIPEHPAGDPTVIAMSSDVDKGGDCQVRDPAADGYQANTDVSYYCDTAGGSSGSPVISRRTNKVIALHHFGGCPNSGVRIDLIYRQVSSLL